VADVVVVVLVAAAARLMSVLMTVQHKVRSLRVTYLRPFVHTDKESFKSVPQVFSFWINGYSGLVL
jgi:hypothetical protein